MEKTEVHGLMNKYLDYSVGVVLIAVIFIWTSCSNENESKDNNIHEVDEVIVTPDFSSDSAYYYVEKQVGFGPRVPNTKEHDKCGVWLAEELRRHGADVIVQEEMQEILLLIVQQHKSRDRDRQFFCRLLDDEGKRVKCKMTFASN